MPSGRRRIMAVAAAVAEVAEVAEVLMIRVAAAVVSAENAAPARGAGADCAMKSAVARGFSNRDGGYAMMPNRVRGQ